MDPHASNEPSPYASRSINALGNVSDIDRELEAYLEEKRGNGGENVDAQLAELRLKRGESTAQHAKTEVPPKDSLEKPGAPSYTAKAKTGEASNPNSHESLIRSLEEKYAQSAQEHNAVPVSENKQKVAVEAPGSLTKDKPAAPMSAPGGAAPSAPERAPQAMARSSEAVNSLRASLLGPTTSEFESVLSALESLPGDLAREIVGEFEPKFARNKERKELFEKTKRDLEEALTRRVKADKGGHASPAPSTSSSQHTSKPAQSSPYVRDVPLHTQIEKPESKASDSKSHAAKSFDVLDSQRNLSRQTVVSVAAPKEVLRPPLQEKYATPTQAPETAKSKLGTELKTIEPRVETAETKVPTKEEVKQYAEEKGLLTVLSYDPQKGFVRKPAHEVAGTVVSVEIDERGGTARVEAKDAQGEVVSSADVPLSDLN